MTATYWVGLVGGMLLGAAKVLALSPLFQGRLAPWGRWVAHVQGVRPDTVIASWAGHLLVTLQGGAVGLAYAAVGSAMTPIFGSVVAQGLFVGLLGVLASVAMYVHPIVRGGIGIRAWVGIVFGDLVHGASVGIAFLIWGPISAR